MRRKEERKIKSYSSPDCMFGSGMEQVTDLLFPCVQPANRIIYNPIKVAVLSSEPVE